MNRVLAHLRRHRRQYAGAAVVLAGFAFWFACAIAVTQRAHESTDPAAQAAILGFVLGWVGVLFSFGPTLIRVTFGMPWFTKVFDDDGGVKDV